MLKEIVEKVEISEGKVKWSFDKSNMSLSGAPTINAEVKVGDIDVEVSIGGDDGEFFAFASAFDADFEEIDLKGIVGSGWTAFGNQYQVDSKNIKDIVIMVERDFKIKVDQKALKELVTFIALSDAGLA